MGTFIKKMKAEAVQATLKTHLLVSKGFNSEIRNAYFSGTAACLCFLDDELDAAEQSSLTLLGKSLHLSDAEIKDTFKAVQNIIGDEDKMSFLREIFQIMDSAFLKYALLSEMKEQMKAKGNLNEDEKDFLKMSANIMFGQKMDIFALWDSGMNLTNIEDFLTGENVPQESEDVHEWHEKFLKQIEQGRKESKKIFNDAYQTLDEKAIWPIVFESMHLTKEQFDCAPQELKDLAKQMFQNLQKIKQESNYSYTELREWWIKRSNEIEGDKPHPVVPPPTEPDPSDALIQKIKKIISYQLGCNIDQVTDEASFIEDLGADSLDLVELVMEIEEKFQIDIPDADAERIRTVGDAIRYAKSHCH